MQIVHILLFTQGSHVANLQTFTWHNKIRKRFESSKTRTSKRISFIQYLKFNTKKIYIVIEYIFYSNKKTISVHHCRVVDKKMCPRMIMIKYLMVRHWNIALWNKRVWQRRILCVKYDIIIIMPVAAHARLPYRNFITVSDSMVVCGKQGFPMCLLNLILFSNHRYHVQHMSIMTIVIIWYLVGRVIRFRLK